MKLFFETPLKDTSKFSIFNKQSLLLTAGISQLYDPSFSVIATKFQSTPSLKEKKILIFSVLSAFLFTFHSIV